MKSSLILINLWIYDFAAAAMAKVMKNENDIDFESFCVFASNSKVRRLKGWMQRYIGETLLNIDDQHFYEPENWTNKAIISDKMNGMTLHLGREYALYAELFKRKGDPSKARENLNKAIEIFKECGADGWVEKYEKELTLL